MSTLATFEPEVRARIVAKMLILNSMLYTMERDGPIMTRYLISYNELVRLSGFRAALPPGDLDLLRHALREQGWLMLEHRMGDFFLVSSAFVNNAIRLQSRMVSPVIEGYTEPAAIEDQVDRRIDQYHQVYCKAPDERKVA